MRKGMIVADTDGGWLAGGDLVTWWWLQGGTCSWLRLVWYGVPSFGMLQRAGSHGGMLEQQPLVPLGRASPK